MAEEFIEKSAPVALETEENVSTGVENFNDEDYEALIARDLEILRASIPELENIKDISELENPVRYGALRDLGLSPEEAWRATSVNARRHTDNRAHLRSSAPKAVHADTLDMSYRELQAARELFSGISDAEIQRLYKKVTR